MITWQPTEKGYFIFTAICGEYKLLICKYQSDDGVESTYEGVYHPVDYYPAAVKTGEKSNIDETKAALLDLVFEQIKKDVRAQSETIAAFWELKRSMDRDDLCKDEKQPSTRSVRELIDAGYMQVSGKYRILARLPPGKTALEALDDISPKEAVRVRAQCERTARGRVLRLNSRKEDRVELTPAEFAEFKRLKGPVA